MGWEHKGGYGMRQFETNDWMVLNNIIYKIYTTEDADQMRRTLLEQLKMVLDFDAADFFLADTHHPTGLASPVTIGCDNPVAGQYDEEDYSRGILYSGKCIVYRETDIISDEKRVETDYYRKVYLPNGWHYSMQMILGKDRKFLGVVTFYRTIGKDNFSYEDIFLLDTLKEHLAYRLSKDRERAGSIGEKLSVTEAAQKYRLTAREEMVLRALMEGKENEQISEEFSISVNTLKKHILNLYRKLGINSRVQMFKMILEKEEN